MNAQTFNSDISSWDISSVRDMEDAFNNATMFNQDLCGWSDTFPYDSASNVFVNSGCKHQETPVNQSGPFCASNCIPTSSPSNIPTKSPLTILQQTHYLLQVQVLLLHPKARTLV